MNTEQLKLLRRFQKMLAAQAAHIDAMVSKTKAFALEEPHGKQIVELYNQIESTFEDLVPVFDYVSASYQGGTGETFYTINTVRGWIGSALAVLEAEIESIDIGTPTSVTQKKDFSFVGDKRLQGILDRDYEDIQKSLVTASYKSAMILAGGAIEALLLDALQKNAGAAVGASKADKKKQLEEWDLHTLIEVALELGVVKPSVNKLSHSVRSFRNLVHPGVELRNNLTIGREEANIAFEILNMVQRDLKP